MAASNIMFDSLTNQIVSKFKPDKVFLFGSQARGTATEKSDIDICVIMNTLDKRKTVCDLYYNIDIDIPIDFLLYTPNEWDQCVYDKTSFAYLINAEGVELFNGQ